MAVTPKSFLRRTAALIALVMSGSVMAADPVVVSSKIDTEGSVLGQMVLQSLEGAGIPVENRLQLGGTSIVRNAIKAKGDSAMWWCAILQCSEQVIEFAIGFCFINAKHGKCCLLHFLVVYANRSATNFKAV